MKNNIEAHSDQTSATSSHDISYHAVEPPSNQAISKRETVFPEPMENMDSDVQPPELARLTAKAKAGLRKGKWTVRILLVFLMFVIILLCCL